MRNERGRGKLAPIAHRRDEAQLLNLNDAPISTRLRSRDKDVEASQNGVTGSHNQTDKESQYLMQESNRSEVMKRISSSICTISQLSRNAKKINLPPLPEKIPRSRQLSEGPNNSNKTKPRSKNECKKEQLAHKRFPRSRSETNHLSSSQVWREKVIRPSKGSAKQYMDDRTRPLRDPNDQPVVEARICYIRSEETKGQRVVGWTCGICEKDLGDSPFEEVANPPRPSPGDYFFQGGEEQQENVVLPGVSVLPCGHVFHNFCWQQFQHEEQIGDGPCIFCLSML